MYAEKSKYPFIKHIIFMHITNDWLFCVLRRIEIFQPCNGGDYYW